MSWLRLLGVNHWIVIVRLVAVFGGGARLARPPGSVTPRQAFPPSTLIEEERPCA